MTNKGAVGRRGVTGETQKRRESLCWVSPSCLRPFSKAVARRDQFIFQHVLPDALCFLLSAIKHLGSLVNFWTNDRRSCVFLRGWRVGKWRYDTGWHRKKAQEGGKRGSLYFQIKCSARILRNGAAVCPFRPHWRQAYTHPHVHIQVGLVV